MRPKWGRVSFRLVFSHNETRPHFHPFPDRPHFQIAHCWAECLLNRRRKKHGRERRTYNSTTCERQFCFVDNRQTGSLTLGEAKLNGDQQWL